MLIVSLRLSPFLTEEMPGSGKPKVLPPILKIAVWKLSLVLVDGSKKSREIILSSSFFSNFFGFAITSSVTEKISSRSSREKSLELIISLPLKEEVSCVIETHL